MRRGTLAIAIVAVLVVGGFLTIVLLASGPGALPIRVQTLNPEASTAAATGSQALAIVLFVLFAVGSLIAGAVVLAFVMRFLDRQIAVSKQEQQSES
ncbi:MAG: hypothetical protein JW910_02640 [Anaerolineae bacterium]|nr:hypothetical protein [Anaerolineae bacterium]